MSIFAWFTRKPSNYEATVTMLRRMDAASLTRIHPKWIHYYGKESGQVRFVEKLIAQRKGFRGA